MVAAPAAEHLCRNHLERCSGSVKTERLEKAQLKSGQKSTGKGQQHVKALQGVITGLPALYRH